MRNLDMLTRHGNTVLRSAAADIVEHGLEAANPYCALRRLMQLNGDHLQVGDLRLDLTGYEHVFILGAGKASLPIAQALEDVLGDRISDGLFVLKSGCEPDLKHTRVICAAHPVPDENGYLGAQAMMAMANRCTEKDLVFAGITGGSSALLPFPVSGVSLADKQKVNELMLFSGADIVEINAVRKHLSQIKGGRLAKAILPATLINLTVSDVVGDPLDYITDPTVPDTSTFEDARRALDRYVLWDAFPRSAAEYLRTGGEANETPKAFAQQPLHTFLVVDSRVACLGAARRARQLGFTPMILTTMLKGEARDAGSLFAAIGREIVQFNRPLERPCALIAGGENTVTIRDNEHGRGGPNQEFALSASLDIAGIENIVVVSVDTDGTDGPTEAAGGMVDGSTQAVAGAQELDITSAIRQHDSGTALEALGDMVITGPTGTNVNDLKLLLVA